MSTTSTPPAGPTTPETDPNATARHTLPSFDGIREMDSNPPRVWTVVYITTAIAALFLIVAYPAIPLFSGETKGVFGWSSRAELGRHVQRSEAAPPDIQARFEQASLEQAEADPELRAYAVAAGHAAFGQNCASCHGRQGQGAVAFPDLADKDWLWGGTREAILHTLHVGIRWPGSEDTRDNRMPAFGKQGVLPREQLSELVDHVRSLSGASHNPAAAARGAPLFAENCVACHGENGGGNQELGAPNLTDDIWLYGGTREAIYESLYNSRAGVMPSFAGRLSEDTLRKLVIYVRSFGGGE